MEVSINISNEQAKFLKQFAKNHGPNADDNLCTANPIHVVQTTRYKYIPYAKSLIDAYGDLPLKFCCDEEYSHWYAFETEAITDYFESRGKEPHIKVQSFEEMRYEHFSDPNGEEIYVTDYSDYFNVYGVPLKDVSWEEKYYEPVAFFFILENARAYIKYQGHNLHKPRTYTYSCGYGNEGEFDLFWRLLFDIGAKLNEEDK